MDGRGRALDNVFIERLWRSLKYELIYPGDFANGADLFQALDRCFHFYHHQRPHQALGYRTPADLFPRRFFDPDVELFMRTYMAHWLAQTLICGAPATTADGECAGRFACRAGWR